MKNTTALSLVLVWAMAGSSVSAAETSAKPAQPNIVIYMIDDLAGIARESGQAAGIGESGQANNL